MSRNFYILAATLGLFALSRRHVAGAFELSAGAARQRVAVAHGGAVSAALWADRAALIGVMSHLFEQVDRRSEEARQAARNKRRGRKA
jgi:hypothetical protein